MNSRFAVAAALNWLIVAVFFAVGVDYLAAAKIKPNHEAILCAAWSDLPPRVKTLTLTLMKGTGMVAISTAVSLSLLLAVPFRRRETWSRWAVLAVAATALLPTLAGAIQLQAETGAASPWWPHLALLAILALAFWLTRDFTSAEQPGS